MSAACTAVEQQTSGGSGGLPQLGRGVSPSHQQTMPNRWVEPHGRSAEARAYWSHRYIRVAGRVAVRLAARAPSAGYKRPSAEPDPQTSGVTGGGPMVWATR